VELVAKFRGSGMTSDLEVQVRELRLQVEMMRCTVKLDLKDLGQQMESARAATRSKVAELGQRLEHQLPGIVREVVRQENSCRSQNLKRDIFELSQRTEKRGDATNQIVASLTQELNRVKDKFSHDVFRLEQQLHHLHHVVRQDVVLLATKASTNHYDTKAPSAQGGPDLCSLPLSPPDSACTTTPQECSRGSSLATSLVSCSDKKGDSMPEAGQHGEVTSISSGLLASSCSFNPGVGPPTAAGLPHPSCKVVSSSSLSTTSLLPGSALQPTAKNKKAQLLSVVDCDSDEGEVTKERAACSSVAEEHQACWKVKP